VDGVAGAAVILLLAAFLVLYALACHADDRS
jgi:hypothetical protein